MGLNIRVSFSAIMTFLAVLLVVCAVQALRSKKPIGKAVGLLEFALLPPLLGNCIILGSSVESRAVWGYYIYLIGMDIVIAALVNFTNEYCRGIGNGQQRPTIMYVLLAADAVQMLLNPFFGHAFGLEPVDVQGKPYYSAVPRAGQIIHRVMIYFVFFCIIFIFILALFKTARLYREKFSVILGSMIIVCVWQTFYIFSRTPVDRSMIGYGVCGVLVFYFSLRHRPMKLLDRMLSDIVSDLPDALFVYDPAGNCIWLNRPARELTHADLEHLERVSSSLRTIFGEKEFSRDDWVETRIVGFGEHARYFTAESHNVSADSKHFAGSFLVIRDNTEEQQRLRRELYNSTHDSLTGLYTKQHFYDTVRKVVDENPDTLYTAVFVDVKDFKVVNDIFSSEFGDKALCQLARWIEKDMDKHCVYGRLAGDTFGIFVPSEKYKEDKPLIEPELSAFTVSDGIREHHLLVQLGVYEVTERDIDVSVMFDRAHLALSTIRDEYGTHIADYDNKLRDKVLWDQTITASLREAIDTMQICPYLQPITDSSGRVVGAEALARWIHPEQGFMPPFMFIPVFEKNGMISEVDKHMWRCACKILADWKGIYDDLFISVNISPKDFYFFDVAAELKALIKEYGLEARKLRIEITESIMMNDQEERMRTLAELRSAGFIVEMDDFGSGYSSLNLLKDMPVDVLKIDMQFLSSSGSKEKAKTIVRNIIRLSDELDIASLTEGVETESQYTQLADMGCRLFQGYYFAAPMPLEDFEAFAFGKQ